MSDTITLPREVVERVETLMKIANKWSDDVDILASTVVDLRDDLTELRAALASPRPEPSGYAYRYADGVLRLNDGSQFNGGWPVEAVPYWFAPPAAEPTKQEPVAYFDLQKQVFYWAKPTMIDVPMTVALNPLPLYAAPPAAAPEPTPPGYIIGSHWLETAYSRVCAGEAEADVLRDCGWERVTDAEALRRDAERYRWMKQEVKRIPPSWYLFGWDAAIDAAMQEDKT